jgi:hypothetical protein
MNSADRLSSVRQRDDSGPNVAPNGGRHIVNNPHNTMMPNTIENHTLTRSIESRDFEITGLWPQTAHVDASSSEYATANIIQSGGSSQTQYASRGTTARYSLFWLAITSMCLFSSSSLCN